jgi:predicted small lipoprotein YifL
MKTYITLFILVFAVLSLASCARDSALEKAPPPSANARPLGNAGAMKPHIGAAQPSGFGAQPFRGQPAMGGQ